MDAAVTAEGIVVRPLQVGELYRPTALSNLQFSTTAELQPLDGLVGQARAFEAIQFGTQVEKAGFNLFVIGPHGARMQDAVKAVLGKEARIGRAMKTVILLRKYRKACANARSFSIYSCLRPLPGLQCPNARSSAVPAMPDRFRPRHRRRV